MANTQPKTATKKATRATSMADMPLQTTATGATVAAPGDTPEPEPGTPDQSKNLYQRIHAVMGDVRRLQKDKAVGSGSYAYKAVSEEKVVTEIRTAMLKHGLAIFPIEQVHGMVDHMRPGRDGQHTVVSLSTVDVRYKLVNIDNPAEHEIIASSGTGVDPQDKGVGKAMTYSMKYALLRTFMIPTGNDPDDVHNEELERQQLHAASRPANMQQAAVGQQAVGAPIQPPQNQIAPGQITTPERPAMKVAQDGDAPLPVQYATAAQKEEISRLLNHPVITRPEKTKMLLNINRLDEERAIQAIAKLRKAIDDRENGVHDWKEKLIAVLEENKDALNMGDVQRFAGIAHNAGTSHTQMRDALYEVNQLVSAAMGEGHN